MTAAAGSSGLKETSSRDVALARSKITTERRGLNLPVTVTRTGWWPPPNLKKVRHSMRDLLRAEKPISFSEAYSDIPDVVE
jgi:hypothetical protein